MTGSFLCLMFFTGKIATKHILFIKIHENPYSVVNKCIVETAFVVLGFEQMMCLCLLLMRVWPGG